MHFSAIKIVHLISIHCLTSMLVMHRVSKFSHIMNCIISNQKLSNSDFLSADFLIIFINTAELKPLVQIFSSAEMRLLRIVYQYKKLYFFVVSTDKSKKISSSTHTQILELLLRFFKCNHCISFCFSFGLAIEINL